jgi:HK97 gp10 family phage protein
MVVKVHNLDKLRARIDRYGKVDMKPFITKATQRVQRSARTKAPEFTGHLARSIKRHVEEFQGKTQGIVSTNVEYAGYVEFGTAAPHFVPFIDAQGNDTGIRDWAEKHGIDTTNKEGIMVSGRPQPFMYPAMKENSKWISREAVKFMRKELE